VSSFLTAHQHSHTDIPLADVTVDAALPYSDGCFYINGIYAGCAASCPVQTVHAVGKHTQACDGTWQAASSDGQAAPVTAASDSDAVSPAAAVEQTFIVDCSVVQDEAVPCDSSTAAAESVNVQGSNASVPASSMALSSYTVHTQVAMV